MRHLLESAPELALFVSLFLGHLLGRLKIKGFSAGPVAGSLIVALLIGQIGVTLPDALKAVSFALFIYAVGFKSGPEFFGGLNRSSLKLVVSALVQSLVGLAAVVAVSKAFGLGRGYAAGIGAGALTETAMMGTAGSALTALKLPAETFTAAIGEMAVAFAITYVFGTIGVIVFLRGIAPRLLGVDLKRAARELEAELSAGAPVKRPGFITPFRPVVARAFEIAAGKGAGKTVAEATRGVERVSIERVLRDGKILEPAQDLVLAEGDVVGLAGRLASVVAAGESVGREIESREALSFPIEVKRVVITGKHVIGKSLQQVRDELGAEKIEGVYLISFKRQGLPMPILLNTPIRRGDVFELAGRPGEVARVAERVGFAESPSGASDLAFHAFAIAVGILLGLVSIPIGAVNLTLGVGGGVLVSGLCFGWIHTRYPVFGALPQPAQWILSELGLSAFAAVVGLSAGIKAVAAIEQQGVALLAAGAIVTMIPLVVSLYVGKLVLKLHPVVLLGALCGGQTAPPALGALNEATESITPVLGFTVTYAISNVLLAMWGPVIVALMG